MKEKIKKFYGTNSCKYLIILLVTIILCIPMFGNKLNIYYDDGIQHLARAEGTYLSLKEGTLLGNIIHSFSNSFGYSWNLFYGMVTSFGIILFKTLTGSYVVGYKLFMALMLFLSGAFMYKLVNSTTNKQDISLLAAIFYLSFPYHLTDLYTRNAVGEFAAFVFIPLVFLGLYNLLNNKEKYYYLPIGAIGLILTHNLTAVITAIYAFIYFLINIKKVKEKSVQKGLLISILFILVCTLFYVAPLLETKLAADYAVYSDGMMATKESFIARALELKQLFVTKEGQYSFEIGIHIIVMLGFSGLAYKNISKEKRKDYLFLLISGLISIFMTTKYFPWKIFPEGIAMVQFPWRFMQIGMFFLSIVAAINAGMIIKRFCFKDVFVMSSVAVLLAFAVVLIPVEENKFEEWSYESFGNMTGKEIECIAGLGKEEYLPMKAYDNKFYIASREKGAKALKGNIVVKNELKVEGRYVAEMSITGEAAEIELPYIYYPGYEVRVDGMIVKEVFETENGMLGFAFEQDDHIKVEVEYIGTNLMKITLFVSIIGFISLFIYVFRKYKLEK